MRCLSAIFIWVSGLAFRLYAACSGCEVQFLKPVSESSFTRYEGYVWSQGEAETNKVDLLIALDQSAVRWLSSNKGISTELYADFVLDDLNAAISHTGLNRYFTFRLAGFHEIPVDLSKVSLSAIVQRASRMFNIPSANTAEFKALRTYRDAVSADVVAILTDTAQNEVYGAAPLLSSEYVSKIGLKEYADLAYCACSIGAVEDRFSLLHEIGHIFGAGHGSNQKSDPGPAMYQYSSGYHFVVGERYYTTVMGYPRNGYDKDVVWERLPFFSSPLYTLLADNPVNGYRVDSGILVGSAKNDNTRTLRNTFPWIANFRVASLLPEFEDVIDSGVNEPKLTNDFFSITTEHISQSGMRNIEDGEKLNLQQFVHTEFLISTKTSYGSPTTVKIKGLPRGLKYQKKTGLITGMPKKVGNFDITIIAKDKLKHLSQKKFTLEIQALPQWAKGEFDGYVLSAGRYSLIEMKVNSSSGKINWSYKENGKRKRFSSDGFIDCVCQDGQVYKFYISKDFILSYDEIEDFTGSCVKIGKAFRVDDCRLIQDTWGRKDLATYRFKKAYKTRLDCSAFSESLFLDDYLDVKLSSKGNIRLSGRISKIKVSSNSKLLRVGTHNGNEIVEAYVVFAPKYKSGWLGCAFKFYFKLAVDITNIVNAVEIIKVERFN